VLEIRCARPADATALASLAGQLGYPATADAMARRLAALLAVPDEIAVRSNTVRAESHPFYERAGYVRVKTQHV
jgi:hypothetical protein